MVLPPVEMVEFIDRPGGCLRTPCLFCRMVTPGFALFVVVEILGWYFLPILPGIVR